MNYGINKNEDIFVFTQTNKVNYILNIGSGSGTKLSALKIIN